MKVFRRLLLGMCIFMGVGALGGGLAALIAPDGSLMGAQELVPVLQEIPFFGQFIDSLALPASALLLFVFVPHAVGILLLIKRQPQQYIAGMVCGLFVVVFTAVELVLIPNFLSWIFLFLGLVEAGAGFLCHSLGRSITGERAGN
ncbi:MAG: hypothetical protein FWE65_02320 [Eggerthellaceae bacterium]|nr:hypothetical protein [Eggerthellaceae bacterium]